ncbi:MAG: ATP-binding protein [Deltaproteobacteria bacterium]|nr:ATP-binding protein [Deltaproteobacteria bacterium]
MVGDEPPVNLPQGEFQMKILGRLLEHLGVQMYKRRDVAIAELVANAWDAGAKQVRVTIPAPTEYDQATSSIIVSDDGCGIPRGDIESQYLVVGRDRRGAGQPEVAGRQPMGRKGIGKLAGFGIAEEMTVYTWAGGEGTLFHLDINKLKAEANRVQDVAIPWRDAPPEGAALSGMTVTLSRLKHKTPLDAGSIREALARRFSRTVKGHMEIIVNGVVVAEPMIEFEARFPAGEEDAKEEEVDWTDGKRKVRYWYGFSKGVIQSSDLRGFTIYVRGKTAQAPPFFFQVEGTASGQHGTRYVTGAIEADFIDELPDNDLISTDRQELDWDAAALLGFRDWGRRLCRRVLIEWADRKGDRIERQVGEDPGLQARVEMLDADSRKQVKAFLRTLAKADPDRERVVELADALVQAYEFRQFHDLLEELRDAAGDPFELVQILDHLQRWQVLESRAILEIVKGRLQVAGVLERMVVNDAPETAGKVGAANLHDLIAEYPWLLHPEWQILREETSITKQLREWHHAETGAEVDLSRFDFLALTSEQLLIVVEIKRPGHAVELEELHRLEGYANRLTRGTTKRVSMMLVYGGTLNISGDIEISWRKREDAELSLWADIVERARRHYEHYRAVLERNISDPGFVRKTREVAATRQVVERGKDAVYRGAERRGKGLGEQDVEYEKPPRKE